MNTFNFCWTALAVESSKASVFLNKDNCIVNNNSEEEFDKSIKRVSYLYKYGSFNINFFSHCLTFFFAEVSDSLKIIDKICMTKNLNICSISTGPGTYVIGFLYALHLLGKPLKGSVNYKFISKHIAWRSMVCEMLGLVPLNAPKPSSCKLIQCDVLIEINPKAQSYIKIADILFLCHMFSSTTDASVISHVLKDILQLLKPGALVFFMSNEDNSSSLKEFTTVGRFLYGPTKITLKDMPYDKTIPTLLQVPVIASGSSFFGVWQKSGSISHQEQSPTVKLLAVTPVVKSPEPLNDIQIIKSDATQSICKLKDSFKVPDVSTDSKLTEAISCENLSISTESSASLKSGSTQPKLICSNTAHFVKVFSGLPTKTISELKDFSKTANTSASNPKVTEAVSSKNVSPLKKNNLSSCSTDPNIICSNHANYVKKCDLSTSTDSVITVQKNEPSKINTNPESTLNSLVKTLERLVTNLEEYVNSQKSVGNLQNQQCCCTCSCHIQNMHHAENWNTRYNFNSCVRNRCYSPRVENYHICSNSSNYCNYSMSNKDNICQNVGSQTTHIVIPLQNTTESALAQVFSLISQVNNSSI